MSTCGTSGSEWEPTTLQSLELLVGRRYYGTSYEFHWKRRGARGDFAVDYTEESVTANNVQFDHFTFNPDTGGFGTPRLDSEVYLRREGRGTFTYRFRSQRV